MAYANDFIVKNGLVVSTTATVRSETNSVSTDSGALTVSGGAGIALDLRVGGTIYSPNIVGLITTATNLAGGGTGSIPFQTSLGQTQFIGIGQNAYALVSNGTTATWQAVVNSLAAGTDTAISSTTGSITIWNTSTLQSITQRGATTDQAISITNATASSSATTGALVVTGGLGVGGYVYAGQLYDDDNRVVTRVSPNGSTYIGVESIISAGTATSFTIKNLGVTDLAGSTYLGISTSTGSVILTNLGVQTLTAGTDTAVSSSTGTVTVWNTSTLQSITQRGATTDQAISITNTTSATNTTTGALTVSGGVGIRGDLWVGGNITAEQLTIQFTTITSVSTVIDDITTIKNGTNSFNTQSGALQVFGGAGIGGNLFVGGTINGTIVGSITGIASTATNLAGGTAGQIPYQTAPGATSFINTGTVGNILISQGTNAPSYQNTLTLAGTTAAISTNSGALQVVGGVGIGGDLYIGGTYLYGDAPTFIIGVTPDLTGNGGKSVIINSGDAPANTTDAGGISLQAGSAAASSSNGGSISLQAGGGGSPGAGGDISLTAGDVSSLGTAGSISLTAGSGGALVTKGNITLDTASGGQVKVTNTDQSTSTTTGALRVYGGVGIGGSLYASNLYDSGNRVVTRVTPNGSTYIGIDTITSVGTATAFTVKNLGVTNLSGSTYIGISTSTGSVSLTNLGVQTLTAGTDTAVSSSTGTVTIWNTSTLQSITSRGATTNQAISITNTASTTSTNSGALTITGGVGIGGGLFVSGTVTATNFVGSFSGTVTGLSTTATNLAGGTAGQVPYQTAPGATSFFGPGTTGTVLVSNGTSAPSYQNTLTLTGTTSATSTNSGALQVVGGVGIGGSLYASNLYDSGNRVVTRVLPNGSTYIGIDTVTSAGTATTFTVKNLGVTNLTGTTHLGISTSTGSVTLTNLGVTNLSGSTYIGISTSTGSVSLTNLGVQTLTAGTDTVVTSSTGTVTVYNNSTLQTVTNRGATTNQAISITSAAVTTSTNSGALIVAGGVGIAGGLFVGGTVTATLFVGNLTGTATTATNLAGGAVNSLPYQSNTGSTAFIAIGVSGTILQSNGTASPPSWTAIGALSAGQATTATNLAGGTLGSIPYQTSTGTTAFIDIGANNTVLFSNGSTATWVSTASILGAVVTAPATPTTLGTVFGYTTGNGNTAIGCCAGNKTQVGCYNFVAGCNSLISNTSGCHNFAVGEEVLRQNTTGSGNVGFGRNALCNNAIGFHNFAAGELALGNNTCGQHNVAIGYFAMRCNISGCDNVAIGCMALEANRADNNIAIGRRALTGNTLGTGNVALGYQNLLVNTTGDHNVSIGYNSLRFNTTGCGNIALGLCALYNNIAGNNGIAIGPDSQKSFSGTVGSNIAIGCGTLCANTTGFSNTAIGTGALRSQTYAIGNTAVGYGAMSSNLTGDSNVAIGYNALNSNQSGFSNTAIGYNALNKNLGGHSHVAIGSSALQCQTGGFGNIALGFASANSSTTSNSNISLGFFALTDNCTGNNNIGLGCRSLGSTVNASCNIGIGVGSLFTNTTGAGNIAIGYQSGCSITTGSYNVVIGANNGSTVATSSCNIIISDGLGNARICANNASSVLIPSTVNATSTQTGALQVAGGVGVGRDLWVGGNETIDGKLTINSTQANTGTAASNALYVAGGAYVNKSLVVGEEAVFQGPVTFSGSATFILSTNTFYTDNILEIHIPPGGVNGDWTVDDGKDIGFRFHYYTAGTDTNAALVLDNTTKELHWYNAGAESITGDFSTSTYGTFAAGKIKVVGGTTSTSISTGDLIISGGAGIAGDVWVGGTINASVTGISTTATNLVGGAAGAIPYQAAPGVTRFIGIGSVNTVLTSNGSTATWVATQPGATIVDNTTTNATYYPVFSTGTSGAFAQATISSSKLTWNPSTGQMTMVDINTTSDIAAKDNINEIADPLEMLKSISGFSFNWRDTGAKSYGVIAQYIEKILPELVSEDSQGLKSVKYLPLIAILIESVKKLSTEIDEIRKAGK